jgi:hypothetical protein
LSEQEGQGQDQGQDQDKAAPKRKLTIDQGKPKYSTESPGVDNAPKEPISGAAAAISDESKQYITKYWDSVGYSKAQDVAKAAAKFDEFPLQIAKPNEDIRRPREFTTKLFKYHKITMGQYDFIAGKKAQLIDIDRMSALTLKEYVDQKVKIPEDFDKFRAMRKEAETSYYDDAAQIYLGMTEDEVKNADRAMLEFWVDVCEHKQINPKLEIPERPSSTYT